MDRIYNQTILDSMEKKNAPPPPPIPPSCRIIKHDFLGWLHIIAIAVIVVVWVVGMASIIIKKCIL